MNFLTEDKLVIVGAAGMIGSNMVQSALMMGLTKNICLYDVFSPEGVAEEMRQSGFDNVNITATTDVAEAFKDAKYIISSGGAPRKEGMTREDLLKGNCEIAEQLGKNIKTYCPDVKHVVIIFNPADLTGIAYRDRDLPIQSIFCRSQRLRLFLQAFLLAFRGSHLEFIRYGKQTGIYPSRRLL